MKGYKGMNADMTCRGLQYEVGKTYHIDGDIKLCENGLHFCEKLYDAFSYYDKFDSRFFEIEASGMIVSDDIKSAAENITIVKELSRKEINRCIYGDDNGNGYGYGYGNGYGYGYGYGDGYGNGYGDGYGYCYGNGNIQKVLMYI